MCCINVLVRRFCALFRVELLVCRFRVYRVACVLLVLLEYLGRLCAACVAGVSSYFVRRLCAGARGASGGGAGTGADGMGPSSQVIVESARKFGVAAVLNVMREFPTRVGVQWRALNVVRELASESGEAVAGFVTAA